MNNPINVSELPAVPAGQVADDIPCIHCNYNLRTLHLDAVCPECGSPVSLTVRADLLRFSNPQWVERLARGTRWILNSICLAGIVTLFVAAVMLVSINRDIPSISLWLRSATLCLGILIVPGCLQITASEPGRQTDRLQSFARWSARLGVIVMSCIWPVLARSAAVSLPGVNPLALGTIGTDAKIAWAAHQLLGSTKAPMPILWFDYLIGIVGWFAMLTYVRQLAMRLPDRHLARQTTALMWALIAGTAMITWVRSVPFAATSAVIAATISVSAAAAIASAISAAWLIALLLRYRDRFAEAAVQAYAWSSCQRSLAEAKVQP